MMKQEKCTGNAPCSSTDDKPFSFTRACLEDLRSEMSAFAKERDWEQFHSPRNLALALVGEVGELCEIFQWKGEVKPGCPSFSKRDRIHLGEELADVLLYLIRLSDRCGIDLSTATLRKIKKNAEKYPAEVVKGKSKKYSEYSCNAADENAETN